MDFAQQMAMDRIDKAILDLLQRDASLGVADLAEKVGLSKAPCWRRIRRLQERGVIRGTVALLDPKLLNVGTTVFVTIKTANHSEAWYERFLQTLDSIPEVVEIYRMSGDVDYLLRVVVPDIEGYGAVYAQLIAGCEFLDISASFAMGSIRHTTALPLNHLAPG
jgi:Lrp/AsnC family transcriptional regulator